MRYDYRIKLDVMGKSKIFFTISIAITIIGLVFLLAKGLHTGVDFNAGTNLDITVGKQVDGAKVTEIMKSAGQPGGVVTPAGERVSIRYDHVLTKEDITKIREGFNTSFGENVKIEENTVDTSLAKELVNKAIYAVLIASLGIIIYVAIRFEWRFGIAAIIALLHDAFIVISLFSIFRWEVNLTFVAAVLTIIGYSINDTIVIFDRIRENLRFAKLKNYKDLTNLVNHSVSQTMTRSINTVLTVLIGALLLFLMGSESIRNFSLAILIGLVCGAYSSIFIASPIWAWLKKGSLNAPKAAAPAKH
ncbi:protein translocase subunit SecF [Gorillibacterium massiliense]|uniref:protein translocase subunit SecF n=1 Tax=Gorillibacterium massiliense TaxID=1280390 RepID=UPI0004B9962A|nr:protein translocase subunit SecF [Gorillibacterium massiliense]